MEDTAERARQGIRMAQIGLLVNAVLVIVKVLAGLIGHSYALVADGIESSTDIFSSLVVWRGLKVSERSADDLFHFGYRKAESLSAAVVALLLLGAAIGISIQAVREIVTPHHLPAPFTLVVLVLVVAIKETLFRRVSAVAAHVDSRAVATDAWHHRSDAFTSGAAFIGILIAIVGGPGWEEADDWAALAAAGVIAFNGVRMLRPAAEDLMDRAPDSDLLSRIASAAVGIPGVLLVEKLRARRAGLGYFVDVHVQADSTMSLFDAHELGHEVKNRILEAAPSVLDVVVHMEPHGAFPPLTDEKPDRR